VPDSVGRAERGDGRVRGQGYLAMMEVAGMTTHRTVEWQSLRGHFVEVRLGGKPNRRGFVDDAMPDGSGLWLASDGFLARQFIDKAGGYSIWTRLYPRSVCS
jgi:hypothetical protein